MKETNGQKLPSMGVYLVVEPRLTTEKRESDVYFGDEKKYHVIVPRKLVKPYGAGYIVKIILSSAKKENGMIKGKIQKSNGVLEERLFPEEDIIILEGVENRIIGKGYYRLPKPQKESSTYAYLDVKYAPRKGHEDQVVVMFGRRTSDRCIVLRKGNLVEKTPEYGQLKVILKSDRNPSCDDTVQIGIPTCDKELKIYFLPKRYIHPLYREDNGKDNSNRR